jgi:hypothetical protein
MVDGSVIPLPAPTPHTRAGSDEVHRAVEEIHRVWREADALRSEPADEVPLEYRAAGVRQLGYRGGMLRNGLLVAAIGVFGLLGVLVMFAGARSEFGPSGLAGVPGSCTAAAAAAGTAPHSWCTVTDGYVRAIDHKPAGGLTLWLGPRPSSGRDPRSGAVQRADFDNVVPALSSVRVGDSVAYVADNGLGVSSVTVRGVEVSTDTGSGAVEGTPAGQRVAEVSGFVGAVCWPLFFGVWAAGQRWPRRLGPARWALPAIAAVWLAGVVGFGLNDQADPVFPPWGIARLGIFFAVFGTACYAGVILLRSRLRAARVA